MTSHQPALRALFASCESGLPELGIRLKHAFVLLNWQLKEARQMENACLQKTLI
jgi:hypothetical protein